MFYFLLALLIVVPFCVLCVIGFLGLPFSYFIG